MRRPTRVAFLDGLIVIARQEQELAEKSLVDLAQDIYEGAGNQEVKAIPSQLRSLGKQLESEKSRQQEATSQRDVTWQAYLALAEIETEIKNIAKANKEVNLASMAVPPQKTVS